MNLYEFMKDAEQKKDKRHTYKHIGGRKRCNKIITRLPDASVNNKC